MNVNGHGNETKLTAKLFLDGSESSPNFLSKSQTISFVSSARIQPDSLTIFNHPSNVITLTLAAGSGHFQAEIEAIKSDQQQQQHSEQLDSGASRLKINQITERSIVVSPLVNNGPTLLHLFDYCVPPLNEFLLTKTDLSLAKTEFVYWQPAATARINVAGINSILVHYDDEKLQINAQLRVYVQISDANGNPIKVKYFSLMNLKAKLLNSQAAATEKGSSSDAAEDKSNESGTSLSHAESELYAAIEALPLEEYATLDLDEQDKEYTAVYTLSAVKEGVVSVQFEAHSDGYFENSKMTSPLSKLIRSPLKEIQIFAPLNVQPKYVELVRGANYQIVASGGPNTPDASIQYEMVSDA